MADDETTPTPDPTVLTTDALRREIKASTELTAAKLLALTERLADAKQTMDEKFDLKGEAISEKFKSIETQFAGRDKATEQLEAGNKTALTAALQTQEKAAGASFESLTAAINKTEAGFIKAIDGIGDKIASTIGSFDDKLNDLKSRLDRGDGRTNGVTDQRADTHSNVGMIAVIIMAVIAFVSLLVAAAAMMRATT